MHDQTRKNIKSNGVAQRINAPCFILRYCNKQIINDIKNNSGEKNNEE